MSVELTGRSKTHRPISKIAREIRADWRRVNYAAEPYLQAMTQLNSVDEYVGYDDARGILIYFLVNATTWRGESARRIKTELREIIDDR